MKKYIITIEESVDVEGEKWPKNTKIFEQTIITPDDSCVSKIAMLINGNLSTN